MEKLEEEARQFMRDRCGMIASDYQAKAKETAIFPENKALEYLSLGLVGEAGEIANKVKKIIRDSKPAQGLVDDLGVIMQSNLDKLHSRKERGTLGGSGDNR